MSILVFRPLKGNWIIFYGTSHNLLQYTVVSGPSCSDMREQYFSFLRTPRCLSGLPKSGWKLCSTAFKKDCNTGLY